MLKKMRAQVFWLTGGSSGIGRELVIQLAQHGHRVYISARDDISLKNLVTLYPDNIIGLQGDITESKIVINHADQIQKSESHIDCLILNAGTAEYVDTKNFNAALFQRVFEINFFANIKIIENALPLLRKGDTKYIVGISSGAVFTPLSRAEAYGASKAAFSYFLDSLRVDLSHEGFYISIVYPGFVKTPLTDKNDFPMPMRVSAQCAAKKIIFGMKNRHQQIVFPWSFCTLLKLLGVLPSHIRNKIMQKFRKDTVQ